MQVLVAYGSKRDGTAGLAAMVGKALEAAGVSADVRPASKIGSLDSYDAVIVGGALYMARWHRDARRFVKRRAAELSGRPVWLFSSARWTTRPRSTTSAGGAGPQVHGAVSCA